MTRKRKDKSGRSNKALQKSDTSALPSPTRSAKTNDASIEQRVTSIEHHFSGPLPPPEILARYDEILPGAAGRVITMAENQSHHRRELESKTIEAQIDDDRAQRKETLRGQVFGFLVAIVAITGGVLSVCLAPGLPGGVTGSIIGGGGVASLVYAFRYGKKHQAQEREK